MKDQAIHHRLQPALAILLRAPFFRLHHLPLIRTREAPRMSTSEAPAVAITVEESSTGHASERAPAPPPAASAPAGRPATARKTRLPVIFGRTKVTGGGARRGAAFFDFLLRLFGIAATLTAAIVMGTTDETLPFFTQLFQFHANYADLPAMTFFVVANGMVAGYLTLSLLLSFVCMVRPQATAPRLILFLCDTVMLALLTAAASSATAIVYLAHNGDSAANWVAICLRFDGFCQRISGSVVASFIGVVFFIVLVVMSGLVMRRRR